jgi:glycine cleavage system T protein
MLGLCTRLSEGVWIVQGSTPTGEFVFKPGAAEPGPSVLYEEHVNLAGKSHIAAFAGYLMPLWYSSIAEEHRAVRERAGVFDCTHMGVLEVSGADAAGFLDRATTNEIGSLEIGRARYSYVLDAAGNVLDDVIVYRRSEDNFMVVVNAANEPKIRFYLHGLMEGRVILDPDEPGRRIGLKPAIRDMRDPNRAKDRRVDIALQGPAASELVAKLTDGASATQRVASLKSFAFVEERLAGMDCLICRTGYTGSKTGYELFVDPEQAAKLWTAILEEGRPLGVQPCGLGARDSLRIEAGLPLYGHELDGTFNISPFEAGYGWAVKLDEEFFIGKAVMQRISRTYAMEVARLELPGERGIRPVRPDDAVLDERGSCVGWVLSSAKVEDKQYALAYMGRRVAVEGTRLGLYYLARSQAQVQQGKRQGVEKGERVEADLDAAVSIRFPKF